MFYPALLNAAQAFFAKGKKAALEKKASPVKKKSQG